MAATMQASEDRSLPAKPQGDEYLSVEKLRKQYNDWAANKREEIEEQKKARRYYHGSQYTDAQIKELKKRKQPPQTYNKVARKINGIVGLVERLRQDPKAFPRTPAHETGAELGTAALRFAMERNNWQALRAEEDLGAATEGIGGVEMSLTQNGDTGDAEIQLANVDGDTYFYDPRSFRPDFSDVRYEGVAKWVDKEAAKEMFPDKADEIDALVSNASSNESYSQQDRERKWVDSENERLFLIEHWYRHKGSWCWCFYVGNEKLDEGKTPFFNENGKGISRFIMYSANVDQDGDRYGFVRNLFSPQDGFNHRQSKALFELNSRRIIADKGAVDDVEKARREYARPDGWVEKNPGREIVPDDAKKQADFVGQLEMMKHDGEYIDSLGPNPQLLGETTGEKSGRAIALLQQAGIADLGPFIISQRDWKLRVYRAVWGAIHRYWTAERWIRVTDSDDLAQFIRINGLTVGPDGRPAMENAIGALDVDIILDEGPDTINVMQDTYETLLALAQSGAAVPPNVLIEMSNLPGTMKKKLGDMMADASQKPDPQVAVKEKELELKAREQQMTAQARAIEVEQEIQLEERKAGAQLALKREESIANRQMKREEMLFDMQLAREKQQADQELRRQELAQKERQVETV